MLSSAAARRKELIVFVPFVHAASFIALLFSDCFRRFLLGRVCECHRRISAVLNWRDVF